MIKVRIVLCWFLLIGIAGCKKGGETTAPPIADTDPTERVDELVHGYMRQYAIPGVTLAIAKDGKLVYVKSYGFADRETAESMTVNTRSRISSISKSVTSIAIMKLLEEGKLTLDDRIFGDGGILGNDFGTQRPYRQYITNLTVKHCLAHYVGGWSNNSADPTGLHNQLNASQLISYIIDNVPLSGPPGSSFAYSNVGYMILGRVIEKLTNMSYEEYVQTAILAPIGITKMEIGGNTLADRKPDESRYHDANAYTRNFSRRDANGGWIATASDVVKLFLHVDGFSSVPDILENETIQTMTTPPFAYRHYALGFIINGSTWSHGGSFAGSRSSWLRTGSGLSAAILVNNNANSLDVLLSNIAALPISWPEGQNL